jgi:hypothetical protein
MFIWGNVYWLFAKKDNRTVTRRHRTARPDNNSRPKTTTLVRMQPKVENVWRVDVRTKYLVRMDGGTTGRLEKPPARCWAQRSAAVGSAAVGEIGPDQSGHFKD